MRRMKTDQGFTLIEVLIVVVILGILAGIVTVGVTAARDRAIRGACLVGASEMKSALDIYAADNGGLYPYNVSSGKFTKTQLTTAMTTPVILPAFSSTTGAGQYMPTLPAYVGDTAGGSNYYLEASFYGGKLTVVGLYKPDATKNSLGSLLDTVDPKTYVNYIPGCYKD